MIDFLHILTHSWPDGKVPPPREDELVTAAWMVASPEDETIAGKVAHGRHQGFRLLQPAQAQTAATTTHSHLAEALAAGRFAIEHDMAAIQRQKDLSLPTTREEMSE